VSGVTPVTVVRADRLNLTTSEARRRFGTAAVARLATNGPAGRPHLVPVTFALDGDRIYTVVDAKPKTTTNLRRLRNIAADPRVTLLADHYEDDWARLWWARADGHAEILKPAGAGRAAAPDGPQAGVARPREALAARYPQYRADPPAGPVIRIRVERWTGWAAAGLS
jgi:PPOX class probable F420-dependent enzyme